jgi:hypothetical protein
VYSSPTRRFKEIYGVDFSGAKLAGRTLWVARARLGGPRLILSDLFNLERACGSAQRAEALRHLVRLVRGSRDALWAVDAPFALPIEVLDPGTTWPRLLRFVRAWERDGYDLGTWCVRRALDLGGPMHLYRETDRMARAPFDCYHYRIIYQTFHAMRDVVWPLRRDAETAILPFQYARLARARRVVFETCPGSTLKRMGLPHHSYKQPEGGTLTPKRRGVRRRILKGLERHVAIGPAQRRQVLRDPGGDALDAVIAAVGGAWAWTNSPHAQIAASDRYRREGFLYA